MNRINNTELKSNKLSISKCLLFASLFIFPYISYFIELGLPTFFTIVSRFFILFLSIITLFHYRIKISFGLLFFFIFLVIYYTRFINDAFFLNYYFGKMSEEIFFYALSVHIIPFITYSNIFIKSKLNNIEIGLFWGFNILSVLALIFNISDGGRLSGNKILNPITIGNLSVSALIVNFILIKNSNKLVPKFFVIIFSFISLLTLIFSSSRGPLLSLVVCFALYFLLKGNVKLKFKHILLFFILCVVGFYLVSFAQYFNFSFLERMKVSTEEGQEEARILLYALAWDSFLKNPILGSHVTTYTNGYVHNFILEILMATGIIGFILVLASLTTTIRKIKNSFNDGNISYIIFALLFFQYLIASLFSGLVFDNEYLWIFFALVR